MASLRTWVLSVSPEIFLTTSLSSPSSSLHLMPCIYATSHELSHCLKSFTAMPKGRITGEGKRLHCPSGWLAWCWRVFWGHRSHQQHTSGLPENPLLSPTPVFSKPGAAGSGLLQCPSTDSISPLFKPNTCLQDCPVPALHTSLFTGAAGNQPHISHWSLCSPFYPCLQ